jgi:hypothetical protein
VGSWRYIATGANATRFLDQFSTRDALQRAPIARCQFFPFGGVVNRGHALDQLLVKYGMEMLGTPIFAEASPNPPKRPIEHTAPKIGN